MILKVDTTRPALNHQTGTVSDPLPHPYGLIRYYAKTAGRTIATGLLSLINWLHPVVTSRALGQVD